MRRAKIVCTIGPATSSAENITRLVECGMDVARLNLARGVAQDQGVVAGSPFRTADKQAIAGTIASGDAKQAAVAMDSVFAVPDEMLVPSLTPEIRSAIQGAGRSTDVAKFNAAMGFMDKMWARAPETASKLFGDDAIHAMQVWQEKIRYQTPEQIAESGLAPSPILAIRDPPTISPMLPSPQARPRHWEW